MIRRIKLIHILLFSFTVTTVVLIAIILGSWRLVISESEESARNRMQRRGSRDWRTAAALPVHSRKSGILWLEMSRSGSG